MSIQPLQLTADRRSRHFGARFWKERRTFLKSKQNSAHDARGDPIRLSGHGIGLVNKSGNATHAAGQNRRGGSEPAHAKDGLRIKFLIDGSATSKALCEAAEKTENGRGIKRREPNGGQFFELKLRTGGKRESVDFLL